MRRIRGWLCLCFAAVALTASGGEAGQGATPPSPADGLSTEQEQVRYGIRDLAAAPVPPPAEAVLPAPATVLKASGGPGATYHPDSPETHAPVPGSRKKTRDPIEEIGRPQYGILSPQERPLELEGAAAPPSVESGPVHLLAETPAATFQFSTSTGLRGGHPADAQLSVSTTHACVTARAMVGCYTKGGRAVRIDPSASAEVWGSTFFAGLLTTGEDVFDMRTLYDHFRQRFWIVGLSTSSNRVLIAISRTTDPRGGWYKWWIPATDSRAPNHGSAQRIDYPTIGIDSKAFYVSNIVHGRRDCDGNGTVGTEEYCFSYVLVNLRDAAQMASGQSPAGWVFWDLMDPAGNLSHVAPVIHTSASTRGYLLANYQSNQILVFAINNPLTSSQSVSRIQVPVGALGSTWGLYGPQLPNPAGSSPYHNPAPTVKFDNLGNFPLRAQSHANKLVFTANDKVNWGSGVGNRAAVRLVRLNVENYATGTVTVEVDRSFGSASANDPPGTYFDYGWAAPAINDNGDMGVMYMRTGSTIHPQVRFSAWYATDTDIRPSHLVQAGGAALYPFPDASAPSGLCCEGRSWYDTAGSSLDPYDNQGLYFAQQYPNAVGWNNYRVVVAKLYGTTRPDVIADTISASQTALTRGGTVNLTLRTLNQGDAPMPASTGGWYLSTNNLISTGDTLLGSFNVTSLGASALSVSQTLTVTLPASVAAGTYYIGACLDTGAASPEYNESNNCNSGSSTSTSLAPIEVTLN
jgi:hypothetical protein